ncbi:MAG: methylated-DNA--[protein]-cysteine S-methyltransferase [Methylocella sp.]
MTVFFALFDTAIGRCAIAWGARGIACVQLPEANERTTRARVLQRFPRARVAAPPSEVERVRDSIVAYLRGEPGDLSSVLLDMDLVPPFHRRVYAAARGIPRGATMTYGALAARAGAAGWARAVGQALARNPFAIIVPCHRVVAAGGRIGGFSATGGVLTKSRLLAIEGHDQAAPGIFHEPHVAAQSRRKG